MLFRRRSRICLASPAKRPIHLIDVLITCRMKSPASSPKRVPAMGATAANGALTASDDLRFKQHGVNIRKVLQLQPRNFLSNEMLNRLQRGQFLAVHQCEGVADVLGATSPSNAMDVIFRMLRHIVID